MCGCRSRPTLAAYPRTAIALLVLACAQAELRPTSARDNENYRGYVDGVLAGGQSSQLGWGASGCVSGLLIFPMGIYLALSALESQVKVPEARLVNASPEYASGFRAGYTARVRQIRVELVVNACIAGVATTAGALFTRGWWRYLYFSD